MEAGTLLAELRKKKGMSQADLADKAGLTQASLSHIESGNKKPHKSTIDRLCEALDIPPQMFYFLTIKEEDLPDSSREKFTSIEGDLKKLIFDTF